MDLSKLMKQAQQMQKDIKKVEDELNASIYEGAAQSGAVKCSVNGLNQVTSFYVEEELLEKDNKEVLEDLIMLAVNEATKKAKEDRDAKMNNVAGGMKIPGLG
ncbi:MAG: YbaB/EbfC family nucleoid-associated protein [Erysipelotrichaceae bacterium]